MAILVFFKKINWLSYGVVDMQVGWFLRRALALHFKNQYCSHASARSYNSRGCTDLYGDFKSF